MTEGWWCCSRAGREVTPTETFKTSNNNDIDMDAGTDPPECAQMAYEAMLESVDTERRRRGGEPCIVPQRAGRPGRDRCTARRLPPPRLRTTTS